MEKIITWIKDYFYMLWGGTVMFVLSKPPKHYLGHVVKGKCPIIVLPGILGKWAFLKPLIEELSTDGHPVYIVPKLKSNLLNVPLSAKIVHELICDENIKDAVIVAHSKGGLVGKYLLANYGKECKILGMVSIATPYSGSSMAKLIPHNAFLELLPDSQIIKKLKNEKTVNKKIISIMPAYDNHVWSESGSYLEGACQNIVVNSKGHHAIIFNKETSNIVKKAVEKLSR